MSIPDSILDLIEDTITKFLWCDKKTKIAKATLESPIFEGGLKLPNFKLKVKTWKFTWLKRAVNNPDLSYVKLLNELLIDIDFVDIIHSRLGPTNQLLNKLPMFYKNILIEW